MPNPVAAFLDRENTVAPAGFNRWLVPPAALAIHLAIGQVYSFSVYKLPLTTLLGGKDGPAAGDWSQPEIQWIFSIAIVFLGLSAALFGAWLERAGPRKAMAASACCFAGGLLVAALGVQLHQIWLLYLGYGVLGGIGLGLGYISPVSTLIKWFPDRPGLATGLAIMGFGGGAMIGSPFANWLMGHFRTDTSRGVAEAFVAMGGVYFLFMLFGVFTVRLPHSAAATPDHKPGEAGTDHKAGATANEAIRTPQFYLLWVMLFVNVTAGIGVLEQASPMVQETFPGRINAAAAAGFVGLLSLFNMAGRFGWSSFSDRIGRRVTYATFFALGTALYLALVWAGRGGNVTLFVLICGVVLTMYGGGFATIPAYLRDMFGTAQVGAIHGRLLTAWSCAGVAGPTIVNTLRESEIHAGAEGMDRYAPIMMTMAALLAVGFVCNLLVRRGQYSPDPDAAKTGAAGPKGEADFAPAGASPTLLLRWAFVAVPLAWGVYETALKSLPLFETHAA